VSRAFFRFCVQKGYLSNSPIEAMKTPSKVNSRARVLSDVELKSIWRACEQTAGVGRVGIQSEGNSIEPNSSRLPAHFATIVKLLILTGQRRGEIAALQTSWINENSITLPSAVTKNGREHTFPIGPLSQSLLSTRTANGSPYLFPARGKPRTPFNGWGKSKAALDELSGVTDWTLHDLRRTFATRLAEMGVAPHVIERLLNHVTGTLSPIALVYNKARYLDEMRAAIDLWDTHISTLTG
jgi:integrase